MGGPFISYWKYIVGVCSKREMEGVVKRSDRFGCNIKLVIEGEQHASHY